MISFGVTNTGERCLCGEQKAMILSPKKAFHNYLYYMTTVLNMSGRDALNIPKEYGRPTTCYMGTKKMCRDYGAVVLHSPS